MPRRIVAIDPGLKTGMCAFWYADGQDPTMAWSDELDEHEVIPRLRQELAENPDLELVVERFTINMATAKKAQAPYSLELIGAIKQTMRDVGRPVEDITLQKPADAMAMFPNEALKKLGYWHRGGAGHALDSIRHAMIYLVRAKWKPSGLLD